MTAVAYDIFMIIVAALLIIVGVFHFRKEPLLNSVLYCLIDTSATVFYEIWS